MTEKFHRIFGADGVRVADVPWADDDNGGLPDWYFDGAFEGRYFEVEVDPAADAVEWIPACGPAPCWKEKFSSFADDAALVAAFHAWFYATY